jgi:hypothetical protein
MSSCFRSVRDRTAAQDFRGLRAPCRHLDLRPVRNMGASLITIDLHYSHVPCDGRESSIRLLDELSAVQRPRWTLVDAAWTPNAAATATVDNGKVSQAGENSKPSDGLEPSTPSLPSRARSDVPVSYPR